MNTNPRAQTVLLTGATGYIGQHLLREFLEKGHHVVCCVRSPTRLQIPEGHEDQVSIVTVDFLSDDDMPEVPCKVDVAYYLIHSLSESTEALGRKETQAASNFVNLIRDSGCQQVIYLSGISNEKVLSPHLKSRYMVEKVLQAGSIPTTILRAGIIVGAGSASFELIRDLVEKLPIMVAPRWLRTRCQPISIENVLQFLQGVALKPAYYGKVYDIAGPDVLSYQQMLKIFGKIRGLKRIIKTVPVMTPRLSSYWLYFVTSVSYRLAVNLVDSMKVEVIAIPNSLHRELGIELMGYPAAVRYALKMYVERSVYSSWKDALSSSYNGKELEDYLEVPVYGCFQDRREKEVDDRERVLNNLWSVGGKRGWYYGSWLWRIRGFMDKMVGGVGLRRGRTHADRLDAGDALDFWRVLVADREKGRLLLFAEMKLPGEAWLEFKFVKRDGKLLLRQTATFRPRGLLGRLYWYSVAPMHFFVFNGMLKNMIKYGRDKQAKEPAPELEPQSKAS